MDFKLGLNCTEKIVGSKRLEHRVLFHNKRFKTISFTLYPPTFCVKWQNSTPLFNLYYFIIIGRSWRSGTKCDCNTDWLWVRSLLEEMKYLLKFIFPFLRSGVEAKRGVELCHSTRNAPKIRQKVRNGVS